MTPQDEGKRTEAPPCSELRCKGMFVGSTQAEAAMFMPGNTTNWWCDQTQYAVGPDKDWVHRTVCTPGRTCYRPPGGPA